ncbi:pilus (MSHA type) biogenesis protein MshL [Opacimonas viscosa]|uniref:Pilus (MSHA type) biogenesis protein MshL n=1 Tax=Opacimonas viscosa TaxID=2961944 RepID=A0AA41X6V6_9ALTE|nr:pilus (MSHA type) biogenesis protein MshL [Opacimonas viscosa]MCP3429674.1 pilus (MSHA type) biogenesis protein MshL [Opacimonas viscosa]
MQYVKFTTLLVASVSLILGGCKSTQSTDVAAELAKNIAEQAAHTQQQSLPQEVLNTLSPQLQSPQEFVIDSAKYDINAQNMDAAGFFANLVKDTPYSVAVHPEVTGSVSLDLKQVPLEQVFSLVSDLYGFHIEKKKNIFRVFPSGMRTETFNVNYLLMQRDGSTQTSIISGGVSQNGNSQDGAQGSQQGGFGGQSGGFGGDSNNAVNGTTITTKTETNFWDDLEKSLKSMVGTEGGRSVFVTPQAGLVTIRALPEEIRSIRDFLQTSEDNLQRQVVLEARILEVELKDEFQQGINWSNIAKTIGTTNFGLSTTLGNVGNDVTASLGNVTSLSFVNQDFTGVLSLLQTQGEVQVLSSPRVTATNNQKAVIKVGNDEYFVTDVSSQNTITSTTTSVVPDIELTPFFSGIALDVTPQIDENNTLLLHVHPSVIETQEQEKVVTLNQEQIVLPLAQSTIRESDTIIKAMSGEIVVIGGLMQSLTEDVNSKTPILGDIPMLGSLFKSKSQREVKKELIILIKPTIVESGTWHQQMRNSQATINEWVTVE